MLFSLPALPSDSFADAQQISFPAASTWVVDPNDPGQNLPLAGRSTFDALFTTERGGERVYDVPFPFSEMLRKIDQHLPNGPRGSSTLKKVLVPLGRSLQRNAAAPDYFKYPRVVVAVDTEPAASEANPILLKDRLFLGYQQKSNVIEVISYNDIAGRFEFQVVTDYGPGLRPKVRYANRALCTSCHQNGAAIFAKAGWDETNSNSSIATRLLEEQPTFFGVGVDPKGSVSASFDNSTDRANLFSTYQVVWREGCEHAYSTRHTIRCRAGALSAMLHSRLSAFSHLNMHSRLSRDYFIPILTHNWNRRWPGGLNFFLRHQQQ